MSRIALTLRLLLLLLLLLAAAVLWLSTRNLNDYREQVATALARGFGRPVQLGEAQLNLLDGLVIELAGLRVGAPDEPPIFSAEQLHLGFDLRALLRGEVRIRRILFARPVLRLSSGPSALAAPPAAAPDLPSAPALFQHLPGLTILQIEQGRILVAGPDDSAGETVVSELDLTLRDLLAPSRFRLDATGRLGFGMIAARAGLHGTIVMPTDNDWLRETGVDLRLVVDELSLSPTLAPDPEAPPDFALRGLGRLNGEVRGALSQTLTLTTELAGDELFLEHGTRTLPLGQIALSARLLAPSPEALEALFELSALDGTAAGTLHLERTQGTLRLTRLALPLSGELAALLLGTCPPSGVTTLLHARRPQLQVPEAEFTWNRSGAAAAPSRLDLTFSAAGTLEPAVPPGPIGFKLAGTRTDLPGEAPAWNLAGESRWPGELLLDLGESPLRHPWSGSGSLSLQVAAAGRAGLTSLTLTADLSALGLDLPPLFIKAPGVRASGSYTATLGRDRFDWRGRLALPALSLTHTGTCQAGGALCSSTLELPPTDLRPLAPHWPLLAPLHLQGSARGTLHLVRDRQGMRPSGELWLSDFGLAALKQPAPLNHAEVRLQLDGRALAFTIPSGQIGSSSVRIKGSVADLARPVVRLELESPRLRASDLVFRNQGLYFNPLRARLSIDGDGILFEEVVTRMPGGTDVTVSGRLDGYRDGQLFLDVEARQAVIDEVIALFRKGGEEQHEPPPPEEERAPGAEGPGLRVQVVARAAQGRIGRFAFENAQGTVRTAPGQGEVYPLRFMAGDGTAVARVAWRADDGPTQLQISGHLDNFDAQALYKEQFRQAGLLSGRLHGDFFLAGETGDRFLASSRGAFNLTLRQGVIRQMKGISRVFSLLNVSQLFKGRLPDIDSEGLPFRDIRADLALGEGVLSTDNLVVRSDALNLALTGELDLNRDHLDLLLAVHPLQSIDKVVSQIPLVGWILTGDDKKFVTAHFTIKGPRQAPKVEAAPLTSLSRDVLGIFQRTLGLPGKVISDLGLLPQGSERNGKD